MSDDTNPVLIGGFVVGAILLVFAAVLALGSTEIFEETDKYVLHFEGSLKGLNVGAPVLFQGIRVGSVDEMQVVMEPETMAVHTPVVIEIERDRFTLVRGGKPVDGSPMGRGAPNLQNLARTEGLRAQLQLQSLVTGQLLIALDFYRATETRFVGAGARYPEIPTVPSLTEDIMRSLEDLPLQELAESTLNATRAVESMAEAEELPTTLRSVDAAARDLQKLLQKVEGELSPLASSLRRTSSETRDTARAVRQRLDPLTSDLRELTAITRQTLKDAQATLTGVRSATGPESDLRYELKGALREVQATARSLRRLADYLERHPEALLRGKGDAPDE
ncbi:MAG: MlaD family protein [Planctomycetota bacterium]